MSETPSPYWLRIQEFGEKINIYDGPEAFKASAVGIPRPLLLVYAANFSMDEVHNGGFLQFFMNSTGILAPEAIEGLQAIGMSQLSALVASAAALLGAPYPRDRDSRCDALLIASGLTVGELKTIFDDPSKSHWQKFYQATAGLDFKSLDQQVYALAGTEAGGFDLAAEAYFNRLSG